MSMNSLILAIAITVALIIVDAYGSFKYRRATGERLTLRGALVGNHDPEAVSPMLTPKLVILCRYASYGGLIVVLAKIVRL
jgi:hypothetical protein